MAKSKYPNQLDNSSDLPAARDISSYNEVINSLRSAILNIEKTLGVNPHGMVGNTVSARLSQSLDSSGNIKASALSTANVLTGPITNDNVANLASISESKLKLNYPTNLLQEEISILNSQISDIESQISILSSELGLHLTDSLNRHKAESISTEQYTAVGSATSYSEVASSDVQTELSSILDGHIKYIPTSISATNNSHTAEQIYFDNQNTNLASINVQDAVEEISSNSDEDLNLHRRYMHTNYQEAESSNVDVVNNLFTKILADDVDISFSKNTSLNINTSNISVTESLTYDFILEKGDYVYISDPSDVDSKFSGTYIIDSFTVSGGLLVSLTVFGKFGANSTLNTKAKIIKRQFIDSKTELLTTVRQDGALSSSYVVQVLNPDSVKVLSESISFQKITSTKKNINISINGLTGVDISIYDSSVSEQSIDSIVRIINEQVSENHYNFTAYKKGSKLLIALNFPSSSTQNNYIKITNGTTFDALDISGFEYIADTNVYADFGSKYYINGTENSGLGLKISSNDFVFNPGSNLLSYFGSLDLLNLGIRKGDLAIIKDSSNDDGTYLISSVTANEIYISSGELPSGFLGTSTVDLTSVTVYKNSQSFEDTTFDSVSGTYGVALFDLFIDKNKNLVSDKVAEYEAIILGSSAIISISDIYCELNEEKQIEVYVGYNDANSVYVKIGSGDKHYAYGDNRFITALGLGARIKFIIPSISNVLTKLSALSVTETSFTIFLKKTNYLKKDLLKLSSFAFSAYEGKITGGELNLPSSNELVDRGSLSEFELSQSFKNVVIEQPIMEMRATGVIEGLTITYANIDPNYIISISSGVYYILGKRINFKGISEYRTNIDSTIYDKIFVALDSNGEIRVSNGVTSECLNPFNSTDYCVLCILEVDGANTYIYDSRLFLSNIDLKLLNSVTVSPIDGHGHFTNISDALKYCRRFSSIYPKAGTPALKLKSGLHKYTIEIDLSSYSTSYGSNTQFNINSVALQYFGVDFPIKIFGEHDGTTVEIIYKLIFSDATHNTRGFFLIPGEGFDSVSTGISVPYTTLTSGYVLFENIKFKNTSIRAYDANTDSNNFNITIKNCIFDYDDFVANPIDTIIGEKSIILSENIDSTNYKGNLSVDSCEFINCKIGLPDVSRLNNLLFTNNNLYGSSSNSLFDINIYDESTKRRNITLINNQNKYANDFTTEQITSAASLGWGDKLSGDLRVGGDLYVYGAVKLQTGSPSATYADEYFFNALKTQTNFLFIDTLSSLSLGRATGTYASFSNITDTAGIEWKVVQFTNTTNPAYIRINIPYGQKLKKISLYTTSSGLTHDTFDIDLYRQTKAGVHSVVGNYVTTTPTLSSANIYVTSIDSINYEALNTYSFYIKITMNNAVDDEYLHYIVYETTMETVQAITGLA